MTPSNNPQQNQPYDELLHASPDASSDVSSEMPYDAKVSPLLDEALKAPAMPADLAQRIFTSTRVHLQAVHAHVHEQISAHWTRRMGPIWLRRANAMAAGIVIAGSAALFLVASGIMRDAHHTVTAKEDIAILGQYQGPQTQLDQEIFQLTMSVEAASAYTYIDTDAARTVSALEDILPPANPASSPTNNDNYNNLF